jgi:LysM repeat protein
MRWRVIALTSVGVNILLAGGWFIAERNNGKGGQPEFPSDASSSAGSKTNLVVRKQPFSWHEVESPDYPTYIANLRDIGCPEQTIRDIIIADVNTLYARRRASEVISPTQQWWRAEPDTNVVRAAIIKISELENERRSLLTSLLGPNWESGDLINLPRPSRPALLLDGPLLGMLPNETKQSIQLLNLQSEERVQQYLEERRAEGKEPDPADIARIRLQGRDEIAKLLSPPQLEEFLLRYSPQAAALRAQLGEMAFFNASPDEFRAIFRSTDPIDQQIAAITGNDPNSVQARNALIAQRENAIRIALGGQRYQQYRLLQDPMYRDAYAQAVESGAPETAQTIYQLNQEAEQEFARIRGNTNLTSTQKEIELKAAELAQLKANAVATSQELPPEPPAQPQTPPRRTYVTRPGDSASVVSMIYGVPISALRAANPNLDLNRLSPGTQLVIPKTTLPPLPFEAERR